MLRQELELALQVAKESVREAQEALDTFNGMAENNVFDTLELALVSIEDKLMRQAESDCEGSYNCGQPTYSQEFIVGNTRYIGVLSCEYNRYDKTYYYIDGHEFTYKINE